jgi:hypothetical protein
MTWLHRLIANACHRQCVCSLDALLIDALGVLFEASLPPAVRMAWWQVKKLGELV